MSCAAASAFAPRLCRAAARSILSAAPAGVNELSIPPITHISSMAGRLLGLTHGAWRSHAVIRGRRPVTTANSKSGGDDQSRCRLSRSDRTRSVSFFCGLAVGVGVIVGRGGVSSWNCCSFGSAPSAAAVAK